jgi:hypothetical protein
MLVGTGSFFMFGYFGTFSHNLSCGINVLTRDVAVATGCCGYLKLMMIAVVL